MSKINYRNTFYTQFHYFSKKLILIFYIQSYQSCSCSLIKNGLDPLPDHRQDAPDRQGEG